MAPKENKSPAKGNKKPPSPNNHAKKKKANASYGSPSTTVHLSPASRRSSSKGNKNNGEKTMKGTKEMGEHEKAKKQHSALTKKDDDDQHSDASSLSSTPLVVYKKMKLLHRQEGPDTSSPIVKSSKVTASNKTSIVKKKKEPPTKVAAAAAVVAKNKPPASQKKRIATSQTNDSLINVSQCKKAKTTTKTTKTSVDSKSQSDGPSSSEEEEAACCLCLCGVDCSDRALFFPKDRKEELEDDEDYYFGMGDPYLDEQMYDRNNALVYCDSCNRLYHQKCHFVPLLVVPRGDWNCLICSIQQQQRPTAKPTKKKSKMISNHNNNNNNKKEKRTGGKTSSTTSTNDTELLPIHNKEEWKQFLNRKVTDHLFQTPTRTAEIQATSRISVLDIPSLEREWETASALYKAQLWHRHLRQLKTFLTSQASNIRRTNAALAAMTSTKRNRQHFSGKGARSQELAQTIVSQTGAKFKIRDAFLSIETLRIRDEPVDFSCLVSWCKQYPEHTSHVFPYGVEKWSNERRIVPRTEEREIEKSKGRHIDLLSSTSQTKHENEVPQEINVNGITTNKKCHPTVATKKSKTNANSASKFKNGQRSDQEEDDDDSGISLGNLQCSVCMIGDATDENDVILCDGQNCHRAFHMKCVYPAVTIDDVENEDKDWFCPICTSVSTLMGEMHDLCIGSEDPDLDFDEEASVASWGDAVDIFPGSEWEYQTAMKLLKGKKNSDTQRLLAMYLGEDISDQPEQMPLGSDSEDENDYSLFDEQSFEERKQKNREAEEEEDSDNDDSTRSSLATLVEMSSVEGVGKDELAALAADARDSSGDSSSEYISDKESGFGRMRKSRRLRKKALGDDDDSRSIENGADFSEGNIIVGKRRRNKVDYRKLNDALFGDLNEKQKSQIDDKDDFKMEPQSSRKRKRSSSSGEESDSDGSNDSVDDRSDNDSSDDGDSDDDAESNSD